MKNVKYYYLYIFIATITRNIIDVYSVVFLYQEKFLLKEIIYIYLMVYFVGILLSKYVIVIGNQMGYKYILMLSSVFTSVAFYVIRYCHNVYLIAIILALSIFTYHPIRHYYGIMMLKQKREVGNSLIFTYMAILLSSYLAIKDINIIYLLIISIIGIMPILFIKKNDVVVINKLVKINKGKLNFFIFDQFRIIFMMLEPLYLYLIANNISYVGVFNLILTISSIMCIYLMTNKINISRCYKYLNIILVIVLIFKIKITNKLVLLIVAFLEGIGVKINELVSTLNLYDNYQQIESYLVLSEKIFCLVRVIILGILYFLPIDLKIMLYILIIGILILSFQYKKDST